MSFLSTAAIHKSTTSDPMKTLPSGTNTGMTLLIKTPLGHTVCAPMSTSLDPSYSYEDLVSFLWEAVLRREGSSHGHCFNPKRERPDDFHNSADEEERNVRRRTRPTSSIFLIHQGKVVDRDSYRQLLQLDSNANSPKRKGHRYCSVAIRLRLLGGMDRQNRVGSKFGGGGVSSSQNAERERKERLRQLALESIDLAKDPYLIKNHLGTYECKLCLTLHTNEANYLAHTQGKKHQAGLARRAHMEKLRQEQLAQQDGTMPLPQVARKQATRKVRIGRPAYQVFKSRDPETQQRCLSFELQYPEIDVDMQPRHRFMSAFEQRVDSPPDRNYQYLLVAADPYETVGFKIPNEPIDKGEERFVTHWDADDKKFTLTLYFMEEGNTKPPATN